MGGIYGSKSRFKVLHAAGRPDERVGENNATGGPNSPAETELSWSVGPFMAIRKLFHSKKEMLISREISVTH